MAAPLPPFSAAPRIPGVGNGLGFIVTQAAEKPALRVPKPSRAAFCWSQTAAAATAAEGSRSLSSRRGKGSPEEPRALREGECEQVPPEGRREGAGRELGQLPQVCCGDSPLLSVLEGEGKRRRRRLGWDSVCPGLAGCPKVWRRCLYSNAAAAGLFEREATRRQQQLPSSRLVPLVARVSLRCSASSFVAYLFSPPFPSSFLFKEQFPAKREPPDNKMGRALPVVAGKPLKCVCARQRDRERRSVCEREMFP